MSVGIIAIGLLYLFNPLAATQGFGLPRPDEGANVGGWLRLKGIRDIASGLVVLALVMWGGPRILGLVLLIEATILSGICQLSSPPKAPPQVRSASTA